MLQQLKSEIKNIKPKISDLRKFGLILSSLIFVWAIFIASAGIMLYYMILGFFILVISFFKPKAVKLAYLTLMFIAVTAGFFLFRILLTVIFFTILTPIRILAYGFRKHKFPDPEIKSYWQSPSHESR